MTADFWYGFGAACILVLLKWWVERFRDVQYRYKAELARAWLDEQFARWDEKYDLSERDSPEAKASYNSIIQEYVNRTL